MKMIVRCDDHGPPESPTREFVAELDPEGYPNNTVVLCGCSGCKKAGKMYLDENEYKQNQHDDRVVFPAENDCLIIGKPAKATQLQGKSLPQSQTGLDDF